VKTENDLEVEITSSSNISIIGSHKIKAINGVFTPNLKIIGPQGGLA